MCGIVEIRLRSGLGRYPPMWIIATERTSCCGAHRDWVWSRLAESEDGLRLGEPDAGYFAKGLE